MEPNSCLNNEKKKESINIKQKAYLANINNKYILIQIFNLLQKRKGFIIIKHNKAIQKKIEISLKSYENLSRIEIEIIPIKEIFSKFINIINKEEELYYHIYFNDSKEETSRDYLTNKDKVNKIKIVIDYPVKSLKNLFHKCKCIESINFINFQRNNINNMKNMFNYCVSLKKINLSNSNTKNVTDMSGMFYRCNSLKELDLSNLKTNNVTDMNSMFFRCNSLEKLDFSNFNTNNVTKMNDMFYECSSLKYLNISNFNFNKVADMSNMFLGCTSLENIILSNFNGIKLREINNIFFGCSEELKRKIKKKIKLLEVKNLIDGNN